MLLDATTARMLLSEYNAWFGPPPLELRGNLIDGRIRYREAVSLGLNKRGAIQPIRVDTDSDAAKYLCLAGHYERARALIPEVLTNSRDVAAWCHCSPEVVAAMFRKPRIKKTVKRANSSARRREAIARMAKLLRHGECNGGTVTTDEIREALAAWL